MTPGELRAGVEELRDNWNTLANQVLGRGIAPRADLPKDFTSMVLKKKQEFRKWYDRISKAFLREMFGTYGDEFQWQIAQYQGVWEVARTILKKHSQKETLKAPSMMQWIEKPKFGPWLLIGLGLGIAFLWLRARK